MSRPNVTISISVDGNFNLELDEVWPDLDEPETIDAAAVVAVMESCGDKERVLADWMLLEGVRVDVYVDGTRAEAWSRRRPRLVQPQRRRNHEPLRRTQEVEGLG